MQNDSFLIGQIAEAVVRQYYRARGCAIIAANFFNRKGRRFGEIDFIALSLNRRSIYFVEVKARTSRDPRKFGKSLAAAQEALTRAKLAKIYKTAEYFLLLNPRYRAFAPKVHLAAVAVSSVDKTVQSIKIYSDIVF